MTTLREILTYSTNRLNSSTHLSTKKIDNLDRRVQRAIQFAKTHSAFDTHQPAIKEYEAALKEARNDIFYDRVKFILSHVNSYMFGALTAIIVINIRLYQQRFY